MTSAPAPGPRTTSGIASYRFVRKEIMFSLPFKFASVAQLLGLKLQSTARLFRLHCWDAVTMYLLVGDSESQRFVLSPCLHSCTSADASIIACFKLAYSPSVPQSIFCPPSLSCLHIVGPGLRLLPLVLALAWLHRTAQAISKWQMRERPKTWGSCNNLGFNGVHAVRGTIWPVLDNFTHVARHDNTLLTHSRGHS